MYKIILKNQSTLLEKTLKKLIVTFDLSSFPKEKLKSIVADSVLYSLQTNDSLPTQTKEGKLLFHILLDGQVEDGNTIVGYPDILLHTFFNLSNKKETSINTIAPSEILSLPLETHISNNQSLEYVFQNQQFLLYLLAFKTKQNSEAVQSYLHFFDSLFQTKQNNTIENINRKTQQNMIQIYANLFENHIYPTIIIDQQGNLEMANKSFFETFGYQNIENLIITSLFHNIYSIESLLQQIGEMPWQAEKQATTKTSSIFPAFISITSITNSLGTPKYTVIIQNITEQKQKESYYAKHHQNTEQVVLTLEKSIKALETNNQIKNQFFSHLSSNLKAPLNKILSYKKALEEKKDITDKEKDAFCQNTITEIGRINTLVKNLSIMSESSSSLASFFFKTISLKDFITFFEQNNPTSLEINITVEDDYHFFADKIKLTQAFHNILLYLESVASSSQVYIQFQINKQQSGFIVYFSLQKENKLSEQKITSITNKYIANSNRLADLIISETKHIIGVHKGTVQVLTEENQPISLVRLPISQGDNFTNSLYIMLIDSNEQTRTALKETLQTEWNFFQIFEASTMNVALLAIPELLPTLIIIDPFSLDGNWSVNTILQAIQVGLTYEVKILIISNHLQNSKEKEIILQAEITDYLAKPYSIEEFKFKINKIINEYKKIHFLENNIRLVETTAMTDSLTGLFNRSYYDKFMSDSLTKIKLQKGILAVIMLDVDNFKNYNDTNGHQMGDEVLKKVAHILKTNVRQSDMVARYGGEEFVIVLPGTIPEIALKIAESLRSLVEKTPFAYESLQPNHCLSISAGVSSYPSHGSTVESIFGAADRALYEAKRNGRNQVCIDQTLQL